MELHSIVNEIPILLAAQLGNITRGHTYNIYDRKQVSQSKYQAVGFQILSSI